MTTQAPEGTQIASSRTSRAAAGWECVEVASVDDLFMPGMKAKRFYWIDPRPLWISRNDRVARVFGDPTNEERRRWVEGQLAAGAPRDLTVRRYADQSNISFLVIGDTGEGDKSQYHVLRPLQACSEGIAFTYLCSDVIYPTGDVNEYDEKFFWPYRNLPGPIYAIPGNHDWYDGLQGFMRHICGTTGEHRPPAKPVGNSIRRALRRVTWRRPSKPDEERITEMQTRRSSAAQQSGQPAPYFAIELGELVLVGIDTGIQNTIDAAQGRWLSEISKLDKPKILLTGKPLYVNGKREETTIEGGGTVNDVVNDKDHDYIAVLGGDIHNYQRYAIKTPDGRTIQHIVSGAGGAYTHATHKIENVDIDGCTEKEFRCYPRRGDSLAAYSLLYASRFHLPKRWVVPYEQAPALVREHLEGGPAPTRPQDKDVEVTPQARRAARWMWPAPGKVSGGFHSYFSEFLDWDEPQPPLFKSFMRIDVLEGKVEMKCFGATGCVEHQDNPPLEDWITGTRGADGRWEWTVNLA
jgi:Calcineurin-like phosphoesterase